VRSGPRVLHKSASKVWRSVSESSIERLFALWMPVDQVVLAAPCRRQAFNGLLAALLATSEALRQACEQQTVTVAAGLLAIGYTNLRRRTARVAEPSSDGHPRPLKVDANLLRSTTEVSAQSC